MPNLVPAVPNILVEPNVLPIPNVLGYTTTGNAVYLTSLANVKAWLGITTTDNDNLLLRLIEALGNSILEYLQRGDLVRRLVTEYQSGVGNKKIMLETWPVLSIQSVSVGTQNIPPVPSPGQPGFFLPPVSGASRAGRPQPLIVNGYRFCRGDYNVAIVYQSGYCVVSESQIIPDTGAQTLNPEIPFGPWAQDDGVTYADGTALVFVPSGPEVGQYSVAVDGDTGVATYTFNPAEAGTAVLIDYSYTPATIEQACIEWVAERFRYMGRIGETTHSLGGQETSAFSIKAMPDFIALTLSPYKKWFPL